MSENAKIVLADVKRHFEDADLDDIADRPDELGFSCSFKARIDEHEPGHPTIRFDADVAPGGDVDGATVKVEVGEDSVTELIEPGTGMHRVCQRWLTDLWETWDEGEVEVSEEVHVVSASELETGDRWFRYDLTVAGVDNDGLTRDENPAVKVRYEETTGTDRWSAGRLFAVVRSSAAAESDSGS
ncbi:hypothetical protein [Brevibacterium oceani]|uniref:hypothetical protein n=1 Tax=Brevibacterium oceani TaxID=358099 RepID=UPI001B342BF1|nr:hypothetical protein [Brevibacterium oceani]